MFKMQMLLSVSVVCLFRTWCICAHLQFKSLVRWLLHYLAPAVVLDNFTHFIVHHESGALAQYYSVMFNNNDNVQ